MAGRSGPANFDTPAHEKPTDELGAEAGSDELGPEAGGTDILGAERGSDILGPEEGGTDEIRPQQPTRPRQEVTGQGTCAYFMLAPCCTLQDSTGAARGRTEACGASRGNGGKCGSPRV